MFTSKIVRHDVSMQNTGLVDTKNIGDHLCPLDPKNPGKRARRAGAELGADFLQSALVYASPFARTRLTFAHALIGAGLASLADIEEFDIFPQLALAANEANAKLIAQHRSNASPGQPTVKAHKLAMPEQDALAALGNRLGVRVSEMAQAAGLLYYEDPALIEVDHGRGDVDQQQLFKRIHTSLFYRFEEGGENAVDALIRSAAVWESVHRQVRRKRRKKVAIFGHGLTNRALVADFLHLRIEQFAAMRNPKNCDIITIAPLKELDSYQFKSGRHGVIGLRLDAGHK